MEAVLHQEVMAEIMDDNMETVLRTRREVVEDSLKSRLEDTVKNRVEDTVKVPGFGFLDRQLWAGLEPLRRVSRAFPKISFPNSITEMQIAFCGEEYWILFTNLMHRCIYGSLIFKCASPLYIHHHHRTTIEDFCLFFFLFAFSCSEVMTIMENVFSS